MTRRGAASAGSPGSTTSTWAPLLALVRRQRRGLLLGVAIGLAWMLGKVAIPQLTGLAIDRSIEQGATAWGWALAIALAGVVAGTFSALRRYVSFRESRLVETRLRERILGHLLGLHIGYHDRAQTGQLMSRASSDLNQVQLFVVMLPMTLSNLALVIAVVAVLVSTDPLLAAVALVPLPLVNVAARRFSTRIHPAVRAVQAEQAELATVVEETVSGVRVVKGFGAEAVRSARLANEADDIQRASLGAARVRATHLPIIDALPTVGLIGVLAVGGHRVLRGEMTIGELVAFNFYVQLLVWPVRTIGMTVAFGQRAAAALDRIDDVLGTPAQVADPPTVDRDRPSARGHVELRDVRFGYRDPERDAERDDGPDTGRDVLDGLDLVVEAGTSVAIVGATGSGKSTIARLLIRFYDPDEGAVLLDGVDLRDRPVTEVRRSIGLVFEDTLLFHDTVRANIAFARPDASDEVIERAARLAGAADFIAELPDGYDTVIGERGYSLSGGQRQRLAIARAVVGDPAVLILDDATSAVDPAKEHEIRAAMGVVMEGRTTIVIAHRPGTIALADRVVLLDEGRIVADGPHDRLLVDEPRYRAVLAEAAGPAPEDSVAG